MSMAITVFQENLNFSPMVLTCYFLNYLLFRFFVAVPGLLGYGGFSLVAASRSSSLVVVSGLLVAAASPVAEHRL